MNTEMITAQQIIVLVINALILPLVAYGLTLLRNWITNQIDNDRLERMLIQTTDAVEKAVAETAQTFVDGIKGTDEWTEDAMQQALKQSLLVAKRNLGTEGMKLLEAYTGEANDYLTSAIEQAVREGK